MSSPGHTGERWRKPHRAGSVALMLLIAVTGAFALASAATAADPISKIEPGVLADVADGQADFWAILTEQADLAKAPGIQDRTARGAYVVDQLKEVADETQGGLLASLTKQGVSHQAFWIVNSIKITGGQGILIQVASQPEVEKIVAERVYQAPDPMPGTAEAKINAVEWGIDRHQRRRMSGRSSASAAKASWSRTSIPASQFDHPALVEPVPRQPRRRQLRPQLQLVRSVERLRHPSLVPCDNNNHGTHTMGTMVGDDGGTNQIGVAPGARWIAAKGCETNTCSDAALLASGAMGSRADRPERPEPATRPAAGHRQQLLGRRRRIDPWYQAIGASLARRRASSRRSRTATPARRAGRSDSPGDYPESYSAGAFDINNVIAASPAAAPRPSAASSSRTSQRPA